MPRIREALDWIAFDLTRPENDRVWPRLERDRAGAVADRVVRHGLVDVLPAGRAGHATKGACMTDMKAFDLAMRQIYLDAKEAGYNATYFLRMLTRWAAAPRRRSWSYPRSRQRA